MDVWRYSDWYGLGDEARYSHPHIWHWRDWIIAALNNDTGYDRMIVEMLAGDELAPADPATVRRPAFSFGTGTSSIATPGSPIRSSTRPGHSSA